MKCRSLACYSCYSRTQVRDGFLKLQAALLYYYEGDARLGAALSGDPAAPEWEDHMQVSVCSLDTSLTRH